jgi:hypothetical protein
MGILAHRRRAGRLSAVFRADGADVPVASVERNGRRAVVSLDHQITKRAADGTLTIAELREFLAEFDRATATSGPPSYTGSFKPKARVSFGGGIKSISVTIPGESEQQ